MNKTQYFILLGIAAATGGALGLLSDRKHPGKGGLLGASAGLVAAATAAGVYHYIAESDKIPYYSSASPFYEDLDAA